MSSFQLLSVCIILVSLYSSKVIADEIPNAVEQQIRRKIFSYAVGNRTEFNRLNDKDYCKYHIFTGALTNLWLQLSIAKDINDIIHEGIKDVTGNRTVDPSDVQTLQETLERIQVRLKSNALLNEHYIDAKTAIETDIANTENKTCKSDVTSPSTVSQSHRFSIHQRFLDETVKNVDPRCDPDGYNRTVLALAVLRVSKKPDQRPAITQLYDEVVSQVVKKITYEQMVIQTDSDCPPIIEDTNVINLFDTLEQKIDENDTLMAEVKRAIVEVMPATGTKREKRSANSHEEVIEDM